MRRNHASKCVSELKRTNTFALAPREKQHRQLLEIADACIRLWNEVNYRRRQSFFKGKINWETKDLYDKYKGVAGSATAQQIQRKNSEAWRSFFALLRLKAKGKLPPHIRKIRSPGYWKDRESGKRKQLMIVLRNDCYKLQNGKMKMPKGLVVAFKGKPKWCGKRGRAEIVYDDLSQKWRVFQATKTRSSIKPKGSKTCYIDLGVVNLATLWVNGWKQPTAFSGRAVLADWWHWTGKIAEHQSVLKRVNDEHTSKRLRKLYRIRRRRFRHAVDSMVRNMVGTLYELGVSRIIVGDLKHIRENNNKHRAKTNSMIHNFWSFSYIVQRIKDVAQEYGMEVEEVSEYKTSTTCVRCGSENTAHAGRLFKCLNCGLEAHRDAVGVLNMANLRDGGTAIGVMAHPLLLRWDGMRWDRESGMNNRPMKNLEPRIP